MRGPVIGAFCALLPLQTSAGPLGNEAWKLEYSIWDSGQYAPSGQTAVIKHVVPVSSGGFVDFHCPQLDGVSCQATYYVNFPNAVAFGPADPSAPLDDILGALNPIETTGHPGVSPFSLQDGAEVTWTETWRSEGFEAVYDMTLTVSCCEAPPSEAQSNSDEAWVLLHTWANSGDVGRPERGSRRMVYDPALGLIVSSTQSASFEGDVIPRVIIMMLKATSQP